MANNFQSRATPPRHWLDALIQHVVEHNGENLSANQLANAILHAPPIVNAIQGAINERAPDGVIPLGFAAEFAREIRLALVRVVECDDLPISETDAADAPSPTLS